VGRLRHSLDSERRHMEKEGFHNDTEIRIGLEICLELKQSY
jgi:hypothetical protein